MRSTLTQRWLLGLALIALALPATRVAAQFFGPRCRPVPPPCCPVDVAAPAEDPAVAVRRVLDEQVVAWNKGDLETFMAGYWSSPELTFFSGNNVTRGWQATLERYRKRYQSEGAEMGQLSFRDLDVQVIGTDHAVVRGRFELVRKKDRPTGLFTLLLKRLPVGWRIVHDHTSS